jgi:arylsulfatase A-like enzyme
MTSWDGGFRVPAIFWWPGTIKPATISGIGVNVDLMRTLASLVGSSLPNARTYDSIDLSRTLLNGEPSPRNEWFYYGVPGNLWAARVGQYKLVFESWDSVGKEEEFERGYSNHRTYDPPLLFDLSTDLAERLDVAHEHPAIVAQIKDAIALHRQSLQHR